jgi:hypothetical protein
MSGGNCREIIAGYAAKNAPLPTVGPGTKDKSAEFAQEFRRYQDGMLFAESISDLGRKNTSARRVSSIHRRCAMTSLIMSGIGYGGYNLFSVQTGLFNEIDTSGQGLITKSALGKAVTAAGRASTSVDALYSGVDNADSIGEQQFSQNPPAAPLSDQMGAQMIDFQAQGWPGTSGTNQFSQLVQKPVSQSVTIGDGSIPMSALDLAEPSAGGVTTAADALYSQLNPDNTGSVNEQLAQSLKASSSTDAAQEALLALHDPASQRASTASSTGDSASTGSSSTSVQLGMGNDSDTGTGTGTSGGNSARDALMALFSESLGSGLSALGAAISESARP